MKLEDNFEMEIWFMVTQQFCLVVSVRSGKDYLGFMLFCQNELQAEKAPKEFLSVRPSDLMCSKCQELDWSNCSKRCFIKGGKRTGKSFSLARTCLPRKVLIHGSRSSMIRPREVAIWKSHARNQSRSFLQNWITVKQRLVRNSLENGEAIKEWFTSSVGWAMPCERAAQ